MKASRFSIRMCNSVSEATDMLTQLNDAKVLAGGQSLIPLMNQRLAKPANLVDVNNIAELRRIDVSETGETIGASTRQSAVEKSAEVQAVLPVVPAALSHVGHPQVRNRGTVVGSICQGDAGAEIPAVLAAVGGTITVAGPSGRREIEVADLYADGASRPIKPDELATAVTFNRLKPGSGWSFQEVTRRKYGVAIVGVVTVVTVTEGAISDVRIAVHGAGTMNRRVPELEKALMGADAAEINSSQEAVLELLSPSALTFESDFHASAGYRQVAARQLVAKGVRTSVRRAAAAAA